MTPGLGIDLEVQQNIISNYLIENFLFVFGSILGLWAVQPKFPGHPGNMKSGLLLLVWASNWTSLWLTTPINSASPLLQNILEAEKTVGQRFCG